MSRITGRFLPKHEGSTKQSSSKFDMSRITGRFLSTHEGSTEQSTGYFDMSPASLWIWALSHNGGRRTSRENHVCNSK
jgi:hypothetical protein